MREECGPARLVLGGHRVRSCRCRCYEPCDPWAANFVFGQSLGYHDFDKDVGVLGWPPRGLPRFEEGPVEVRVHGGLIGSRIVIKRVIVNSSKCS